MSTDFECFVFEAEPADPVINMFNELIQQIDGTVVMSKHCYMQFSDVAI